MPPVRQILVVGATGRLARPVIRELLAQNFTIRALVRDPQRAAGLLPEAVELVAGDLSNTGSLRQAAEGIDAVYINLPATYQPDAPFVPEIHGIQNLLAALPRQTLVSKLSEIEAVESPHYIDLSLKARSERLIQESGHPYIIFRPTWFMESLSTHLAVFPGTILYAGRHPFPRYWIAAADLGKQVAAAMRQPERAQNRIFTIQGPEAATFAEAARRYAQVRNVPTRVMSLPLWVSGLTAVMGGEWRYNDQVMRYYNQRSEPFAAQDTWDILGKPTTTIEDFAAGLNRRDSGTHKADR